MAVNPKQVAKNILTDLVDAGNAFNGAKLGLFQNIVAMTPNLTLADLTPCDFDGYALSSAITWGTVYHDSPDAQKCPGSMKQFLCTGDTTPNTAYGWYMVNGAGDTLLLAENFDSPIGIVEEDQGIALLPTLVMPNDVFV